MEMSRQHFQLIAEVLASLKIWEDLPELQSPESEWEDGYVFGMAELQREAISAFAARLASTNQNFNTQRFIDVATGERER